MTIPNHPKVLVIDDEASEINYAHAEFKSESLFKPDLNTLLETYRDGCIDIFKCDTSDSLTLIDEYGTELSLHLYDKEKYPNIMFIKLSTADTKKYDADILLSVESNKLITERAWQYLYAYKGIKYTPVVVLDGNNQNAELFTGYENYLKLNKNVQHLINIVPTGEKEKIGVYPALYHCLQFKYTDKRNNLYQGYLPAYGQIQIVTYNYDLINYVLKTLGYESIVFKIEDITRKFWACNEANISEAWLSSINESKYTSKNSLLSALPIFKKI